LDQIYRIVARGLKQGFSPEQAAALLAGLLKRSPDEVKPLLGGRRITVKKKLSLADATKYQVALDRCGCVSEIEAEADAAQPDSSAPKPIGPEERERMDAYARQIRDTLSKELGAEAGYDMRSVEWLAKNLNAGRHKYTGELATKVANLYGAFLGKVLIDTYADALPVWAKTPEGVGVHFRKPNGRSLEVVFPIARVARHIEHGDEQSILAFMRAQQQFLAKRAPEAAAAPQTVLPDRALAPAKLQIDDTADGQPLTVVIPRAICCNCGTSMEIHSITSVLSKRGAGGVELTFIVELPFCVPCVPTADRVRPNLALAVLTSAAVHLMNRSEPGQTSHYQPVILKTIKESAAGIVQIGFKFTNPIYEKEFARANKQEIAKGRIAA
jgi:hypothetical protein